MACMNNLIDLTGPGNCSGTDAPPTQVNNASSYASHIDPSKLRYWENIGKPSRGRPQMGVAFRIMSYNILAQLHLEFHSYLYQDCAKENLDWNNRFQKMYREIIAQDPDILCLQELQFSHVDIFHVHLKKHGYKYIYKQRTGIRVDGCAIFFKSSVFDLVEYQSIEFRQPSTDILNRDNIAIMVKLRSKQLPQSPFVVCTTHLLYNPKRIDVRLAQMQVLLAEIDRFGFHSYGSKSQYLPVIVTGDLNSMPSSPVVRLLSEGYVNFQQRNTGLKNIAITDLCQHLGVYLKRKHQTDIGAGELSLLYHSEREVASTSPTDTDDSPYQSESYETFFNGGHIKHKLNLTSAYNFRNNSRPQVTTHHNEWVMVDYIFFNSGNVSNLQLTERYRLPSENECEEMGPIPNDEFGSDHFSVAAGFRLTASKPSSSI